MYASASYWARYRVVANRHCRNTLMNFIVSLLLNKLKFLWRSNFDWLVPSYYRHAFSICNDLNKAVKVPSSHFLSKSLSLELVTGLFKLRRLPKKFQLFPFWLALDNFWQRDHSNARLPCIVLWYNNAQIYIIRTHTQCPFAEHQDHAQQQPRRNEEVGRKQQQQNTRSDKFEVERNNKVL